MYKTALIGALFLAALIGGQAIATQTQDFELTFSPSDLSFGTQKGYDTVSLGDCNFTTEIGAPQLPALPVSVAIPRGTKASEVVVTYSNAIELYGHYNIIPAQKPKPISAANIPTQFTRANRAIYSSAEAYPGQLAVLTGTGSLSGHKIASLMVHPVQYQPSSGKLILYTDIRFSLMLEPSDDLRIAVRSDEVEDLFAKAAEGLVINPDDVEPKVADNVAQPLAGSTVEMLIITGASYVDEFQQLADWKTKKGIPTEVVSTSWIYSNYSGEQAHDNADKIRQCIKDYFQNKGLAYVLMGGDVSTVPDRNAYVSGYTMPSDLYFSDLDGTWNADGDGRFGEYPSDNIDMYCDIYIGRASVDSAAEATRFITKVLAYEGEQSQGSMPTDYQLKVLFMASRLDSSTDTAVLKDAIDNESLPARFSITKLYQRNGNLSPSTAITEFNKGYNLAEHAGHGAEDVIQMGNDYMYNSQAYSLTNAPRFTGNMYSLSCHSGEFEYSDCWSEQFLKAPNGGGFYVGNSNYGWYSPGNPANGYSADFDRRYYTELVPNNHFHAGEANGEHKNYFVPTAKSDDTYRFILYELNLFGDPETPIWLDTPAALSVTHPATLPIGSSAFGVHVTSGGSAVNGALVTLWKGDEVYLRGSTNSSGDVTLYPSPATEGTMFVTVTKQDRQTYQGSADVTGSAYILPSEYTLVRGVWMSGTLADLYSSDDSDLVVQAGPVFDPTESPIWVRIKGTATTASPSELTFTLEASANTSGLRQRIELYNYNTSSYEIVDERQATTSDSVVEVTVSGDPSRFVDPDTLEMRAQMSWKPTGPILIWPFHVGIDQSVWSIPE
jgi:hypothetical protein